MLPADSRSAYGVGAGEVVIVISVSVSAGGEVTGGAVATGGGDVNVVPVPPAGEVVVCV